MKFEGSVFNKAIVSGAVGAVLVQLANNGITLDMTLRDFIGVVAGLFGTSIPVWAVPNKKV